MPARLGAALRLPSFALVFLALGVPAFGQARPPQRENSVPKRVDTTPFRRIDIGDLRVELMALNDESCPLQLLSGREGPSPGRHKALWVEVESLSAPTLGSYALVTLAFDAAGNFRGTRHTPVAAKLETGKRASVELSLDYGALGSGDWLVVAVERVAWDDGHWRSDGQELVSVATERVRAKPN